MRTYVRTHTYIQVIRLCRHTHIYSSCWQGLPTLCTMCIRTQLLVRACRKIASMSPKHQFPWTNGLLCDAQGHEFEFSTRKHLCGKPNSPQNPNELQHIIGWHNRRNSSTTRYQIKLLFLRPQKTSSVSFSRSTRTRDSGRWPGGRGAWWSTNGSAALTGRGCSRSSSRSPSLLRFVLKPKCSQWERGRHLTSVPQKKRLRTMCAWLLRPAALLVLNKEENKQLTR